MKTTIDRPLTRQLSQMDSQDRSDGLEAAPTWLAPPVRSGPTTERFRELAEAALAVRCPICRTHANRFCSGAAYERDRYRVGRELLHVAWIEFAALSLGERAAERKLAVDVMWRAVETHPSSPEESGTARSYPSPRPTAPSPSRGRGVRVIEVLTTTLDTRLRSVLNDLTASRTPRRCA